MKRKLLSFWLSLLLLLALIPTALCDTVMPMVIDSADLLSDSEEQRLETAAQTLRSTYSMDVVILTVSSLDGTRAQDYADGYYDINGYGFGDNADGILFLLAMEEREWYISTCGAAIYAVTDYGAEQLGSAALPYLSDGAYYDAFQAYLNTLAQYLEAHALGNPIDGYAGDTGSFYHGDQEEILYYEEQEGVNIILSVLIGAAAATAAILIMRIPMNTKKRQYGAADYLNTGSYHLRTRRDIFLYSNVTKSRKQQSSSSGGGSSVHRSSSGRRHGGGGGKF